MKKLIAEAIGTYFLVLLGTGAIAANEFFNGAVTHLGISAAFGLAVFLMIFSFGKISGAHINPAVSIGLFISDKFRAKDVLPYCVSQILGAILASLTLKIIFSKSQYLGATLPRQAAMEAFFIEFIMTFSLMLVILIVPGNANKRINLSMLAASLVVGLEAYFGGPITGASMNPARSIGPAIVSGHLEYLWLYCVAPIVGAVSASYTYLALRKAKS